MVSLKISCAYISILCIPFAMASKWEPSKWVLPPISQPQGEMWLSTVSQVMVRRYRFIGSSIFSQDQLADLAASYTERLVRIEELEELRQKITRFYIQRGYVNSGALLPEQKVDDGIITLRIIEGNLDNVVVKGNTRLRSGYVTDRICLGLQKPLNIYALQKKLQTLRLSPVIAGIQAELKPGETLGKSFLEVDIEETPPFHLALSLDNVRSPSIGAERFLLDVSHHNILGFSDRLALTLGLIEGGFKQTDFADVNDFSVSYTAPITPWDSLLTLHYAEKNVVVIEEPFADLNIESDSEDIGITLKQPLVRTVNQDISLSLRGEYRKSQTRILGESFSFSGEDVDGKLHLLLVRLNQEWIRRSKVQVSVLRSSFNFGRSRERNRNFFSWRGDIQYIYRSPQKDNQLILRTVTQWSGDDLPSVEKFSIGGKNSVRGYRENTLVRNQGIFSSLEFRIPFFHKASGDNVIWLAPFLDYGWAADIEGKKGITLASMGLGILFRPWKALDCQLYWGHALKHFPHEDTDIQDNGIHFRIHLELF